jgi:hypothetical protein
MRKLPYTKLSKCFREEENQLKQRRIFAMRKVPYTKLSQWMPSIAESTLLHSRFSFSKAESIGQIPYRDPSIQ